VSSKRTVRMVRARNLRGMGFSLGEAGGVRRDS